MRFSEAEGVAVIIYSRLVYLVFTILFRLNFATILLDIRKQTIQVNGLI